VSPRRTAVALPRTEVPEAEGPVVIDHAAIAKKTYLLTEEAAAYVGYEQPRYAKPKRAFLAVAERAGLPKFHFGTRVLYARKDLDLMLSGRLRVKKTKPADSAPQPQLASAQGEA
jgi:hypothetical protein